MATSRNQNDSSNTSNRGFASMDENKQREIASKGGKAAHEKGTAHEFDSEEAAEAGRKGGQARGSHASQERHSSSSMRGKADGDNQDEDDDNGDRSYSDSRRKSSRQHADTK